MKHKLRTLGIIAFTAIIGLSVIGCENGTTPEVTPPPPPPPERISQLFTGVHAQGFTFNTMQRELIFMPDGTFQVGTSGLFPWRFMALAGTWVERYHENVGHIIDIVVAEDFHGQINMGSHFDLHGSFQTFNFVAGAVKFSFVYELVNPNHLRITQTMNGVVTVNNNASDPDMGGTPGGINHWSIQLGSFSRGVLPEADIDGDDGITFIRPLP
jgi:hypothetical protein